MSGQQMAQQMNQEDIFLYLKKEPALLIKKIFSELFNSVPH